MDSFEESHKKFGAAHLALNNSLVIWEILQNIQTSQELLNTFRLISKLWDETAVRILNRRKSIALNFRYHVPTQEFYSTAGTPWYRFDEKPPPNRTLSKFLLLLQELHENDHGHRHFPVSRFSFEFRQRVTPFAHPNFQKFLSLYGKDQIQELRVSFPTQFYSWSDVGGRAEGGQIQTQIQTLVLPLTPHIQKLVFDEFWSSEEFDRGLEPAAEPPVTVKGVEESTCSALRLLHLHTLVLNDKLQLNSNLVQGILKASPHLTVIKNMTMTPEMPGLLGTTSNPGHIKNIMLQKKMFDPKSAKLDPEFDLRLDQIKLPGIVPPYQSGACPKPCMDGPEIPESEFEKHLQILKQALVANRATLRKLKLKSTLYYYPDLQSLPEMDYVTFFQMPVKESLNEDHCRSTASLAKWLNSANFPSLRHLSIIFQDSCDGCSRPLFVQPELSFFNFLQPLESVKRLDISGDSYGHYIYGCGDIRLGAISRVFPALKTLSLDSLVPSDFSMLGCVLWKMTSLERLELEIMHDEHNILKPIDVDSAFTGLSEESLGKVLEIMMGIHSTIHNVPESCLVNWLLEKANVTRGASILDLKGLKNLDLKLMSKVNCRTGIPESLATFAPLTGILAMGPLRKLYGTRIRVWTKYGWSCHPWTHK